MKPQLIDYKTIMKNPINKINKINKIKEKVPINIDRTHIIFNIIGLIFIIIGIYTLYFRNKDKEKNKFNYETKIDLLNKKINVIS